MDDQQLYGFASSPISPNPALDTYNQIYTQHAVGPLMVHPGTGITPINQIPLFAGPDFLFEADLATPARPSKPRRRRTADGEYIKHRRTRNGCYTCRGRRIKCDEGRPLCERCRKGSRDCVYPDTSAEKSKSKSPQASPKKTHDQHETAHLAGAESPASTGSSTSVRTQPHPDSIPAEDGEMLGRARENTSSSGNVDFDKVNTPEESPESYQTATVFTEKSSDDSDTGRSPFLGDDDELLAKLQPDLRELLKYHYEHIGACHYMFRQDATQFVKGLLPSAALTYQPLLYALCGFAAYHRAVAQDGRIQDFLGYYNDAVMLLLRAFQSGKPHTEAMLMTILQLATIEEYLGDWVNLVSHQNAAHQLIRELFTPESMVTTETRRKIFSWFARFDIFVGILSGYATTLDMDWSRASEKWHFEARRMDPSSMDLQIRWLVAYKRVLDMTLANLSSKAQKGQITKADFAAQYHDLMDQLAAWGRHLMPLVAAAEVTEPLPHMPDHSDRWVDGLPRAAALHLDSAWALNMLFVDLYSTSALQRASYARIMGLPDAKHDADILAKEGCRMIEAMDGSPYGPEGAALMFHAVLAMLGIFLDEPEYQDWVKRKLAKLESMGYSYPAIFRKRLADTWSDASVLDWWLPNGEGHRAIIKSLRAFNLDREGQPRDKQSQDLKELTGFFEGLMKSQDL